MMRLFFYVVFIDKAFIGQHLIHNLQFLHNLLSIKIEESNIYMQPIGHKEIQFLHKLHLVLSTNNILWFSYKLIPP